MLCNISFLEFSSRLNLCLKSLQAIPVEKDTIKIHKSRKSKEKNAKLFLHPSRRVLLYIQWFKFRIGKETKTNGYKEETREEGCKESRKEKEVI